MTDILAKLVDLHARELAWLRSGRPIGMPGAVRGVLPTDLPAPKIGDIHNRTKDKRGIGVVSDGKPILLEAPVSVSHMRRLAHELIYSGVHPEDIVVWDYDPEADVITDTRTAIDHLLWTTKDQLDLEETLTAEGDET